MRTLLSLLAAVMMCALLTLDTSAAEEGKGKGKGKKGRDPAAMIKKRDKNNDNQLSLEEFTAGLEGERLERATGFFKRIDKNSDGQVTLEEFKAIRGKGKGKKKDD